MSKPSTPRSAAIRRWWTLIVETVQHTLRGRPQLVLCALLIATVLLIAATALARPGGGHTYSGGSRGGGSSSGGGGDSALVGVIVDLLIMLIIEHPAVGIPLTVLAIGGFVLYGKIVNRRGKYQDWASGASITRTTTSASLRAIRTFDPNFSIVLFEDFLYSLFAELHHAGGTNQLPRFSAYLTASAMWSLHQRQVANVHGIVVGAMRIVHVSGTSPSDAHVRVGVDFEANYTERTPQGTNQGRYVHERWFLTRRHGPLSREPGKANVLTCPSCGAPLDVVTAGRCSHCNQQVNNGSFDWTVQTIQLISAESRGPMLTSNVAEQGTNLPTIYDPEWKSNLDALAVKDPNQKWEEFQARVHMIFSEFQTAWSARDLKSMRPFLSDTLFQTQSYWVEAYKQQQLRNITERARITGLEIVKVTSDRFYDSITVRLWGTGLDYTVNDSTGRVVSGSKTKERKYSEYWTFMRSSTTAAPAKATKACSNCGAPLAVNMAGYCEYCRAKVTSGQFDWVLSKIEQDESYQG